MFKILGCIRTPDYTGLVHNLPKGERIRVARDTIEMVNGDKLFPAKIKPLENDKYNKYLDEEWFVPRTMRIL